jgi:hypothetical protein
MMTAFASCNASRCSAARSAHGVSLRYVGDGVPRRIQHGNGFRHRMKAIRDYEDAGRIHTLLATFCMDALNEEIGDDKIVACLGH